MNKGSTIPLKLFITKVAERKLYNYIEHYTQKAYLEEVVSFPIQLYYKKPKLKIINVYKTIKIIFRIPKSGNTYTL